MMEYLSQMWQEILARPYEPMAFRLYLQPVMSMIYGIVSALKDAREHRPPYFWALFTDPSHRAEFLRDGWKSVRNVFLLAIGMDLVYQITVLKAFRPVQGLIVAVALALVPYLLIRGPVSGLARLFGKDSPAATGSRPS